MSRDIVSVQIADLSQFVKSLRAALPGSPGHLAMLGLVAKAAGYRNYQHLLAQNSPRPPVDQRRLERALRHFDVAGLFAKWPGKTGLQHLCVWAIWAQLPARLAMTEPQISARIDALCSFRDAAHIRRTLVELDLFRRNIDGSVYERREQNVPVDAAALLAALKARRTVDRA